MVALFTPEMLCSNGQSHLRFPSSLVSTELLAHPDSSPGSRSHSSGPPLPYAMHRILGRRFTLSIPISPSEKWGVK